MKKSFQLFTTSPSLKDRLFTATLAPIVFNLSLLIIALAFRLHRDKLLFNFLYGSGKWLLFASIALPATLGFMMGNQKFSILLGHFFYSNMDHEKSTIKTLLCWITFILINYLYLSAID